MQAGNSAPSRRALTLGLVLSVSMAAFEALAVATILPTTLREIGGLPYYGWAFTSFMLANIIGIPLSGREADRRGPVAPFLVGIVLFTAGLSIAGLARSMQALVLGRVLQGAGAAAISSVSYVAIARAYPAAVQPRIMAFLSTAWVVPGIFGPALAAGIAKAAGWRAVFLGLAPLTALAGGLALFGLRGLAPPSTPPITDRGPARNATLLAVGVGLSLLGLRSPHLIVTLLTSLAGAGLSLYAVRGLLPIEILRVRPGLSSALWGMVLLNFAFFAVEAFLPLALTEVRRADSTMVAASLTAGTLAWTAGSWLQTRAIKWLARRTLLRIGLGSLLCGQIGATCVLLPATPPMLGVIAWMIAGFGMGIAFQVLTLAIIEAAPSGREGELTSFMQIGQSLAISLGTGLGGDLVNRLSRPGQPSPSGIALADAAALVACVIALVIAGGIAEPPKLVEPPT